MYIAFEKLPNNSRIWIYQSNRNIESTEIKGISKALENFMSNWDSHGTPLSGSYKIFYNRFIVMAVDDQSNVPSGCSIDKSVEILKRIEKHYGISLFNRTQIAFWNNDKIETVSLIEINNAINNEKPNSKTVIFNNTINTILELENNWQILAQNSWMKKYFKKLTD